VGEYWDTSTTNENNWVNASGSSAFDFSTKNTLDSVFNNNNYSYLSNSGAAPGLIGVNRGKAVTFVDDHDTAASGGENMLPMPSAGIPQAYAYILTHPGVPCVDWTQYWSNQSEINTLISIRKQQGINSMSPLSIQTCNSGLYSAIVNGNTAMKIGPNSWSPSGSWTLKTSGTNYAVWALNNPVAVTFTIQNANTSYGQSVYVAGNIGQLGNWTAASAFPLTIQGSGANAVWSGTIYLPASTTFQYKYVKWDGSTAVWEGGNNRQQTTPSSGSVTYNDGNF
jgi:alpha-amylase